VSLRLDFFLRGNPHPVGCVLGSHEEGALLDDGDIREFLRTTYPQIVGAVAVATGDRAAAEDAVQEAVLRAWQRSERGEQIDRLDAWVATVALNLSRSRFRRLGAERRARSKLPAPSPDAVDDRLDVSRAVVRLPRRQRQAVVLRYLLGHTTAEIARAMGTSEGTVKSQLSKARARLAQDLSLNPDEEADHADA
jgi:RNA polymerase sigma-70 factor (ECF subfamily)